VNPNLLNTNTPIIDVASPSIPSTNTPISPTQNTITPVNSKSKFSKVLIIFFLLMFICLFIDIIFIVSPAFRSFIYHKNTTGVRFYEIGANTATNTSLNKLLVTNTMDFQCRDEVFFLSFKLSSESRQINSGNWNDICIKNQYTQGGSYWLPQDFKQTSGLSNNPVISGLSIPSESQLEKFYVESFWRTYPGIVGLPTGDGRFFNIIGNPGGGITLLPANYQEKRKNISISITSLGGKTKTFSIFNNVLEFSTVKTITDYKNKRLWLIFIPGSYDCYKITTANAADCNITLSYLAYSTGKVTKVYEMPYENTLSIYPLAVSPEGEVVLTLIKPSVTVDQRFLLYDPNSNKTTLLTTNLNTGVNLGMGRNYETDQIAEFDREGNLYIVASQPGKSGQIYKLSPDGTSSWITLDFLKNSEWDVQLTLGQSNNILYAVNNTWDGNNFSVLDAYDLQNNNLIEANQITQGTEDVRGIYANNGYFLAGYGKGLGIYSQSDKTWKFVKKSDGLMEDNVRDIKVMGGNTVCVTHEDKGSSCFSGDIGLYYSLLSEKPIAGNKLNPTPTPPPKHLTIAYTPITDSTNWKTFNDAKSYIFQYPSAWSLWPASGTNANDAIEAYKSLNNNDRSVLDIYYLANTDEIPVSGLSFSDNSLYLDFSSRFTINGLPGVIYRLDPQWTSVDVYLKSPSGGILIIHSSNIDIDTLNKIVSSIKLK